MLPPVLAAYASLLGLVSLCLILPLAPSLLPSSLVVLHLFLAEGRCGFDYCMLLRDSDAAEKDEIYLELENPTWNEGHGIVSKCDLFVRVEVNPMPTTRKPNKKWNTDPFSVCDNAVANDNIALGQPPYYYYTKGCSDPRWKIEFNEHMARVEASRRSRLRLI